MPAGSEKDRTDEDDGFSGVTPPKEGVVATDDLAGRPGAIDVDDTHIEVPPHTTESALMRRIDFHVVPFLAILYLTAFIDRINIANAKTFGLVTDLNLTGVEYNTALTIFFVPYVFFEIPSNILLKKLSPRIWLSCCGMGFAAVTVFQGLVKSYSGLLATRFFLGFFECGMFPGCFYLLSMWYRREDAQRRYSFFFSSTSLAGAFSGLLASAIGKSECSGGGGCLGGLLIPGSGLHQRVPWLAVHFHH